MSTMLPSPPKSLGMLGDVLISALKSVQGLENPLQLPKRRSVCVLLIDGLGSANLASAGGHARFLNSLPATKISCGYPATTSSSLTSLATGLSVSQTGFIGYQVFDRDTKTSLNLLSGWESIEQAKLFQQQPTISELSKSANVAFEVVSPEIYRDSGFTAATMRDATFHGVNKIADRFKQAQRLLREPGSKIVYLYVPELDQIAHGWGCESTKWLNALEELDGNMRDFVAALSKDVGLLITADHGVIDVAKEDHLYIDEHLEKDLFDFVGGDTRGLFLYCKENIDSIRTELEKLYEHSCYITTPRELIAAGYWTESEAIQRFGPDLILLAKKNVALYHRGFAKAKSLNMVGHHGSITNAELSIPLIRIGI